MENFTILIETWYQTHKRSLPWRDVGDPYAVWVSEIILQQTRVAQGLDYYRRFMERFPTVQSLADATEDEVLRLWQGLGYYSRARNLHRAAQSMNGVFPTTYEGVRALSGVGDYTAAAICSMAYGMPYAVVDGNVYRVLARYFGVEEPIDTTQGKKYFARLAEGLLDRDRPGVYNQALMDFGALQCVPTSPQCAECPLSGACAAYAGGKVEALPVKSRTTRTRTRYFHYLLVKSGDTFWIHKRTGNDIWKGLYEFPLVETDKPLELGQLTRSAAYRKLLGGLSPTRVQLLRSGLKHVLTHQVIYAGFYLLEVPDGPAPEGYLKVAADNLPDYAFPRLITRLSLW